MSANDGAAPAGATTESPDNRPASIPPEQAGVPAARPSRLWLWVVAAFALQAAAWTAWFIVASHFKVQEVPLATKGVR